MRKNTPSSWWLIPLPATARDEGESNAAAHEKSIAERFMQVLMRRPAPGTALDRGYGYQVQSGSLDKILKQLENDVGNDVGNDVE